MTKVLVTGGGGFLGQAIIRQLLSKHNLTLSHFSRQYYPELEKLGVKSFRGDLRQQEDISKAIQGQDVVFHTAALAGIWGRPKDFEEINYQGTLNVLDACHSSGVKTLIYTSTPSVVFGKESLEGVDESQPYPEKYLCDYARTKAMAEQAVLKVGRETSLKTIALRPHLIYGPGDRHLTPKLLERARSGKLRQVGEGENLVDVIHVENAAHAHLCAWQALGKNSDLSGNTYFVADEKPVKLWSFVHKILAEHGMKKPLKKINATLAYQLGFLAEKIYQLFSRYEQDPPMTRFLALQLSCSHYFSHQKAKKELGYLPFFF